MTSAATTQQVYATIAKKSKANGGGATGADTVSHLQAIEELLGRLGRPLHTLVTVCDLCSGPRLAGSPLWPPPRTRRGW